MLAKGIMRDIMRSEMMIFPVSASVIGRKRERNTQGLPLAMMRNFHPLSILTQWWEMNTAIALPLQADNPPKCGGLFLPLRLHILILSFWLSCFPLLLFF